MQRLIKNFLCILLLFAASVTVTAQTNSQSAGITKVPKFKPPVVKTYLGENTNGDSVTSEQATQLITMPLQITDNKKMLTR